MSLKKKWIGAGIVLLVLGGLAADAFWIEPASFIVRAEALQLPGWRTGLRIAALSDLHIGSPHVGLDKLRFIVEKTNSGKPDMVILLGDFVIGGPGGRGSTEPTFVAPEQIAAELKNLRTPLGVYAVLGNHDWWYDGPRVAAALRAAGIHVLENQSVRIEQGGEAFWLGGIADLWTAGPDVTGTLAQTNPQEPVILITHNPDVFPDVPPRVSLMIAGHTHGGQVEFPWFGTPVTVSKYRKGHIVEDGRHLFVTTGVGTSIAPIRFRVTPELVILSLTR